MAWAKLEIEETLEKSLKKKLPGITGEERYSDYVSARRALIDNILPEIKAKMPELTDHGEIHVAQVLNNIEKLLGDSIKKIEPIEMYCLCISVLFHDVGNLFGRGDHQINISDIYDFVRGRDVSYQQEKYITLKICGAHCGYADDGTQDTLKDLLGPSHLYGNKVGLQELAALLRFADELEEGPKRTSAYMLAKHNYTLDNEIHHKYSQITSIHIDRGNARIAVTYNIKIDLSEKTFDEQKNDLKQLLEYIYKRIIKLDQERKYTKYYCDYLNVFRKTEVQFNFWLTDKLLPMGLEAIILTDKIIPGDAEQSIPQGHAQYEVNSLISMIENKITESGE